MFSDPFGTSTPIRDMLIDMRLGGGWRGDAAASILKGCDDPDYVPRYRVPKHRPWWQFWKPVEWEEVRGVSQAQWARVEEAMRADSAARVRVMAERGCTNPLANIYAPWVTEALAEPPSAPPPNSEDA